MIQEEKLKQILADARTIAVIGAKDAPGQPVDRVGRYLIAAGYDVMPVHPKRRNVWGLPTFENMLDIPRPVGVVNVFRASQYCLEHAKEALKMRTLPVLFWMQLGIRNEQAAGLLAGKGVLVVENACLMVEHARLFGEKRPAAS